MASDQGQVGTQLQGDGQVMNIRTTNDGAVVVTEEYGKYFELARRSQVYAAVTTSGTGVTIGGIGSVVTYPTLWNPVQYNKIVIPLFLNITPVYYGAAATVANYPVGGFCVGAVTNAVAGINSTYLAVLTNQTPTALVVGRNPACSSQWSPVATMGSTGVVTRLMDLGVSGYAGVFASTPNATSFGNFNYDFHGALMLAPGGAISFAQNATAGATTTFHITLIFAEIPAPPGF